MAVDFEHDNTEYLNIGSGSSIDNIWAGGGSVAFWIKLESYGTATAEPVCGKATNIGDAGDGWVIWVKNTGNVQLRSAFSGTRGTWTATTTTLSLSLWYHVAVLYNHDSVNNNAQLYINGVSQSITEGNTPVGSAPDDSGQNGTIGGGEDSASDASGIDGLLEDIRWWKGKTLTQEEISALAAGYRGVIGGESVWLSLSDARGVSGGFDGTSLATGTNLCPDLSANSNDGDPVNTPTGRASEAPRYGEAI